MRTSQRSHERGFTLIEMLVYLVVGSIVVASVHRLMTDQQREHVRQREIADTRATLRNALTVLAAQLRAVSASGGDLSGMNSNSFVVRSIHGTGTACGIHNSGSNPTYDLIFTSGDFRSGASDSVLVYAVHGAQQTDDEWKVFKIQSATAGTPTCQWGGGIEGTLELTVTGDTSGVRVGGAFRAFRRTEFALFDNGGEWWVGRKEGAAGAYEALVGPLRSPTDSGLVFNYYDAFGNPTATPADVASVEILLRALRSVPPARTRIDSLRSRVWVRGN